MITCAHLETNKSSYADAAPINTFLKYNGCSIVDIVDRVVCWGNKCTVVFSLRDTLIRKNSHLSSQINSGWS